MLDQIYISEFQPNSNPFLAQQEQRNPLSLKISSENRGSEKLYHEGIFVSSLATPGRRCSGVNHRATRRFSVASRASGPRRGPHGGVNV